MNTGVTEYRPLTRRACLLLSVEPCFTLSLYVADHRRDELHGAGDQRGLPGGLGHLHVHRQEPGRRDPHLLPPHRRGNTQVYNVTRNQGKRKKSFRDRNLTLHERTQKLLEVFLTYGLWALRLFPVSAAFVTGISKCHVDNLD